MQGLFKMGKISKAEAKWYGSNEHFRTEKSYEDHLKDVKAKLKKKKWVKVNPMTFGINRNAGKIVQGDDEFMVWGLGKTSGFGTNYADLTKRKDNYEIAVGSKFTKKPRWKEYHATRDVALKNLIKKMREIGKI